MDLEKLARLAQSGNKNAESDLFGKLRDRFYLFIRLRVMNEQDREEILQNVMTVIFEKYRDIKFEVGFLPWAYKVMENKLYDFLRSEKVLKRVSSVEYIDVYQAEDMTGLSDAEIQLMDCLRRLGRQNKRYARVLVMHYQGYSIKEICGKMKLSRDNYYTILSRARGKLRKCLKIGDDDE